MRDFYTAFYDAIERSSAYGAFCERVFGRYMGQHGFADLEQLELLLQETRLAFGQQALDLGCGNGMIAEYLADRTGATVTGLDYIPLAILHARTRTAAKAMRLSFQVGDINELDLPPSAFDVILSIDTLYFSTDLPATLRVLKAALRPRGQLAILYSLGREPWVPVEAFARDTLLPDQTPVAAALRSNGMRYRYWDLTASQYELAHRSREALRELYPGFETEGTQFIYENRLAEANGIIQSIEEGLHARYLYLGDQAPRTAALLS